MNPEAPCRREGVTPDAAALADSVTDGAGRLIIDCEVHGEIGSVRSGGTDELRRVEKLFTEHQAVIQRVGQWGWCSNRDHDGCDHTLNEQCVRPLTDAEFTAELMADSAERDRRTIATYPTGAHTIAGEYIAQYRPY